MRQKVENKIWRLNAYVYDVASTMELYYLRTAWYMYIQSKRISEMLMWSSYDCLHQCTPDIKQIYMNCCKEL